MNKFEFLKFTPIENEKYQAVITLRYDKSLILRYKVQKNDKGGHWFSPGSVKVGVVDDKTQYEAAFELDSRFENEELQKFLSGIVKAQTVRKADLDNFDPDLPF